MKKSPTGTGSILVVLVFTVLCLTIFTLICLSSARTDKAMADAEARMVKGYYEADLLAECILADLLEASPMPDSVRGINIISGGSGEASFSCPISDTMELYVKIAFFEDPHEILEWRMRNAAEWEPDFGLPVWSGD